MENITEESLEQAVKEAEEQLAKARNALSLKRATTVTLLEELSQSLKEIDSLQRESTAAARFLPAYIDTAQHLMTRPEIHNTSLYNMDYSLKTLAQALNILDAALSGCRQTARDIDACVTRIDASEE